MPSELKPTPSAIAATSPEGEILRRIFRTWWPLAASWLLMGLELPVVSAVLARLARPEISLAAYGGVVFPISMMVEAPIIMLLSASTALSQDWESYRLLRRVMMRAGLILTTIHVLIAFTPLYSIVVGGLIHPPAEVLGPARIGLMIMVPWTWSIAYRRFHQGVLIRFGRPRRVGIGTVIRLSANGLVLAAGYAMHTLPGIVVGSAAVAAGVVSEAVFIGLAVRPILRDHLRPAPPIRTPLTLRAFFHFYIPLALTSLLGLIGAPLASAGLSRMPRALDSLAVWPVVTGLTFSLRSFGFALNEVVVALLEKPGFARGLRRFAFLVGGGTTLVLLLIALTPLSRFYFGVLSALSPALTGLAVSGILTMVLMPGLAAAQSWFQGQLVCSRRTRGIIESVGVYLAGNAVVLGTGIASGRVTGLYVGLMAVAAGTVWQMGWLWYRSRGVVIPLSSPLPARELPPARPAGSGRE